MSVSQSIRLTHCIERLSACRDEAVRNYREQAGDKAAEEIRRFYQDRIDQMQGWLRSERNGWPLGDIEPWLDEFERLANPPQFRSGQ